MRTDSTNPSQDAVNIVLRAYITISEEDRLVQSNCTPAKRKRQEVHKQIRPSTKQCDGESAEGGEEAM